MVSNKVVLLMFVGVCWLHRGVVEYEDYYIAVNLPDCPILRQVFRYFDVSDRGQINFRQVRLL